MLYTGQRRSDIRINMTQVRPTRERLEQIFQWAISGVVRPQVSQTFRAEEAEKAYAISESGHARGKMVITF